MAGDLSEAEWIAPRLTGAFGTVGLTVPIGFPAYARICHPVEDRDGQRVTWSQVAATTRRRPHPLMQWRSLVGSPDVSADTRSSWTGNEPEVGNLAPDALEALLGLLAEHTATPDDCEFCLWDGYGWIQGSPAVASISSSRLSAGSAVPERTDEPPVPDPVPPAFSAEELSRPRLKLPHRDYLLLEGPLPAAKEIGWSYQPDWFSPQSPNLFWPADRAWCVATEIDFDSTLVAGPVDLVDAILRAANLDSWAVRPDDSFAIDGDHINSVL